MSILDDLNSWKQKYEDLAAQLSQARTQLAATGNAISNPTDSLEWVRVETAYTPVAQLEKPLVSRPAEGGTPSDGVMRHIRPKITLKFKGLKPIVAHPWGEPGPSKWPYIATVGSLGLGALGYAVSRRLFGGVIVGIGARIALSMATSRLLQK